VVYAWSPNSDIISYHGGNRGQRSINFQTGATSDLIVDNRPNLLRIHGIAMFTIWGVLFPCKYKIINNHFFGLFFTLT
jgi:hypothetical protein